MIIFRITPMKSMKLQKNFERILSECTKVQIDGKDVYISSAHLKRFNKYKWSWRGKNKNQLGTTIRMGYNEHLNITAANYLFDTTPNAQFKYVHAFSTPHIYHWEGILKIPLTREWPLYPPYKLNYKSPYLYVKCERAFPPRNGPIISVQAEYKGLTSSVQRPGSAQPVLRATDKSLGKYLKRDIEQCERAVAMELDNLMVQEYGWAAVCDKTNTYSALGIGLKYEEDYKAPSKKQARIDSIGEEELIFPRYALAARYNLEMEDRVIELSGNPDIEGDIGEFLYSTTYEDFIKAGPEGHDNEVTIHGLKLTTKDTSTKLADGSDKFDFNLIITREKE